MITQSKTEQRRFDLSIKSISTIGSFNIRSSKDEYEPVSCAPANNKLFHLCGFKGQSISNVKHWLCLFIIWHKIQPLSSVSSFISLPDYWSAKCSSFERKLVREDINKWNQKPDVSLDRKGSFTRHNSQAIFASLHWRLFLITRISPTIILRPSCIFEFLTSFTLQILYVITL